MYKLLTVFLAFFCVQGQANLLAKQAITWSPTKLVVPILAGTAQQVDVSFTSFEDLADVDITATPKLARFVSIRPSHFKHIAKGSRIRLSLMFSVPSRARHGTYEGTLLVRSCRVILPRFLPVHVKLSRTTSSVIPPDISIPSLDRIVTDPATGLKYAANEIVLFASSDATKADIISLALQSGATFLGSDEALGLYELSVPFNNLEEVFAIIARLGGNPHVSFATLGSLGQGSQANVKTPSDPFWSNPDKRWAQEAVHLPGAWYYTTGKTTVKLGIVDLGFDTAHQDLAINTAESDIRANFVRGHGTAVASLAAGIGENYPNPVGLAGAIWSSELLVFSCSAPDGSAWTPWCQHVTRLAIDRGVSVINMSFGTEYSTACVSPSAAIEQAFRNDIEGWRRVFRYAATSPTRSPNGVVFVMGAGNDLTPFDRFVPAALSLEPEFPNAISVGALDRLGNRASYSNYGEGTVWAPGGDGRVKMCAGRHSSPTDQRAAFGLPSAGIWTAQEGNSYDYMAGILDCFFSERCPGTSLAAPFVTGTAGLMLSANPQITASQIKNIITTTADDTGNRDPLGNPIKILNAFRAVQQALAPALTISTFSCVQGAACSGTQGTTFNFTGRGFTAGGTVPRFIQDSSGTRTQLLPLLSANVAGQISWSFTSTCSNIPGTFFISAIDSTTGRTSNTVTEIITPGNCPVPPNLTISTSSCATGAICAGAQGTTFNFLGSGYTPAGAVPRFIQDSSGTRTQLLPLLSANAAGQISWSFTSTCSNTTTGTFLISAIDNAAGRTSNTVSEIITAGNCAPAISVNPSSPFNFGIVNIGSSKQQNFAITNTGMANLAISQIVVSPSEFSFQAPSTLTLSPGASTGLLVTFTPLTTGLKQGSLTITSNAPPATASLTGTGSLVSQPTWTQRLPTTSPPPLRYNVAAFDAARQQVVLVGLNCSSSCVVQTWVWDGIDWSQMFPANAPSDLNYPAIAYDAAHSQVVLTGSPFNHETWTWDGTTWTLHSTPVRPSLRFAHSMAYDDAHAQIVLFGGVSLESCCGAAPSLNDTWAWDGTSWAQVLPPQSPPPTRGHAMTYDAAAGKVVLTGGQSDPPSAAAQTWFWDGTTWTQGPSIPNAGRYLHVAAYDEMRQSIVFFGGVSISGQLPLLADTWVLTNLSWMLQSPSASPSGRAFPAMTYDAIRHEVVLFGGFDDIFQSLNTTNDTWVWSSP